MPQPGRSRPEISVVVPTYNRSPRCARLVEALAAQTLSPERFEVIIVDDCSGDDTSEMLESLVADVPYTLRPLRMASNSGAAAARNRGWRVAKAPFVAYTDDDCVPDPEWLESGLAILAKDDRLGIVQGRTVPERPLDADAIWAWKHSMDVPRPTPYFETCNIFYRREVLEVTGGFNEEIGWWFEDTAAGWSVVEAGWDRGFADDAVVVHDMTDRGIRWFVRTGLLESNLVRVAAMHPGFREEAFWRPWSYRREGAAFFVAAVGIMAALRWRPAALAALPYMYLQRPPTRNGVSFFFRQGIERVVVDAARSAGHMAGSARFRRLVL